MFCSTKALHTDLVDTFGTGRAHRVPATLGNHLQTADGWPLPGARGSMVWIFSLTSFADRTCWGESCARICFYTIVNRFVDIARKPTIDFAGIAAHARGNLRRQQSRDNAIFVCRPDAAIQTDNRGTPALFPSKSKLAVRQAIDEPLGTDLLLVELPAEPRSDAINHLPAYYRAPGELQIIA